MSKLTTISDYIHECITNDKMMFIAITSSAEGKVPAEGFQYGMGKSSLAGGVSKQIHLKYHSMGEFDSEKMVKENMGYNWEHLKNMILKGYDQRVLCYIQDDLQQIAGKDNSHSRKVKWMAYQLSTKRPNMAVFIATFPDLGKIAKCFRELFDFEIKVPIRGYYEVQQIKTKTDFDDPLNPYKKLHYFGEAEFPKPSEEWETWYRNWRLTENKEEFLRGWNENFGEKNQKNKLSLGRREIKAIAREKGLKFDDGLFNEFLQELETQLTQPPS